MSQDDFLRKHSLLYVTPSDPQTGAKCKLHFGHSQYARSPLSTQNELLLQERRLHGPRKSK